MRPLASEPRPPRPRLPTGTGSEKRRELPIRDEAVNYFLGVPGADGPELELTYNFGVSSYELGSGYGHVAVMVDDLEQTLARLASEHGIEPERSPYRVREDGALICFVRDPDSYLTICD